MAISAEDRGKLVALARAAAAAQVTGVPRPRVVQSNGVLAEQRGCFVTLTNAGRLRGCIGTFQPRGPLGEMIVEMGASAAGHDPRFLHDPITPTELDQLTVEVSVLSPLEKTDDPAALTVGAHGIYVVQGARSGCFLPEVATDMGWGAEEFLDQCCQGKANLPPGAWRDPRTTVYLFTSEKFNH
ncbi:MAG: AmmeMemoRadiSam system protein A [Phycisphaerae bacterium]|jgi:AmmeMemoRadiSam system protein A|nr:AmmeMemoRadiSam system protein A [Phycisphaerae bacterium]